MSVDRLESRYALRVLHGVKESFQEIPSMRMYHAQFDDPQLAEAMMERAKAEIDLQRQRDAFREEFA